MHYKPDNLTEMNKLFVLHTIYRHLKRNGLVPSGIIHEYELTGFDSLSKENYTVFLKLAKLAFDGLQQNKLVFTFKDIRTICPGIVDSQNINGFGLLQTVQHYPTTGTRAGITVSFNFIHFTIQEYLAAFHVSTLPTLHQSILMGQTFWDGRFSVMWMMYVGIVGINSPAFVSFISLFVDACSDTSGSSNANHPISQSETFSQDIQRDKRKCLHLFQCYMEAKNDIMPKTITSIFKNGKIKYNDVALFPHHISSLIFFMSASTKLKWRTLDLSNCNLRSIGMHTLLEHAVENKIIISLLKYVDLSRNNASPWGVYCVIIRHCCVEHLTLCGDDGMEEYVKEVAYSLEENKGLEQLTLCSIGRTGIKNLKQILVSNTTLLAVNLSWKKISSEVEETDMSILLHMRCPLKKNWDRVGEHYSERVVDINIFDDTYYGPIPTAINVANKDLKDGAIALIAFGLLNNTTVKRLDLSCNKISDDGALDIGNCLQQNATLKSLDLSLCSITRTGMNYLLQSIKDQSPIRYMDLSRNDSSPWGVYCAIIRHCCVNSLTLCGDNEMERYIKEIADSLELNKTLKFLTLCSIGRIGLEVIKEVLRNNTTLNKVNLSWTKISDEGTRDKRNILLHTKCILDSMKASQREIVVNILHESHCRFAPKEIVLANMVMNDDMVAFIALGLSDNKRLYQLDLSCNYITSKGLINIAESIVANSTLRKLDISDNSISDDGVISIGNCIKINTTIKEVDLSSNKISVFGMNQFSECISDISALEYIDLSENDSSPWGVYSVVIRNCQSNNLTFCGDHGMEVYVNEIRDSLKINKRLRSLNLFNIGRIGVQSIKEVLATNTTLNTLNLSWKKFRHEKVKNIVLHTEISLSALGNMVDKVVNINILNDGKYVFNSISSSVSLSHIDDDNVFLIAFGLCYNSILQTLYLSLDNHITSKGAKEIAKAIEVNSTLQKLDISFNNISFHGMEAISNSLRINSTLLEIVVSKTLRSGVLAVNAQCSQFTLLSEGIADAEALIVTSLLYNNNCADVKEIDFSDNEISDVGITTLSDLLRIYPLQKLNISRNQLSEVGITAIVESLMLNTSLQELNMSYNKINIEGSKKIADLIKLNKTLLHLDISYCDIPEDGAIVISKSYISNNVLQAMVMSWKGSWLAVNTTDLLPKCDLSRKCIGNSGTQILLNLLHKIKVEQLNLSYNNITDEGVLAITDFLKQNNTLKQLIMSHNKISGDGAYNLAKVIQSNTTLQKLDISHCDIPDDGALVISSSFKSIDSLQQLKMSWRNNQVTIDTAVSHCDLSSQTVGKVDAEIVSNLLCNSEITELNISHVGCTNDEIMIICDGIRRNSTLQKLIMQRNKISIKGANKIAEVMLMNATLQTLDISGCDISDKKVAVVCDNLVENTTLQVLDMSLNKITIKGAKKIAKLIQLNKTLQKLSISNCSIIDDKVTVISNSLTINTTLLELNISNKKIAEEGAERIAEVIQSNATLQNVSISNCGIIDDWVVPIGNSLIKNTSLQKLDVSYNKINTDGAKKIAEVIQLNATLQKLNISYCCIPDDGVVVIGDSLKNNTCLQELDISCN